MTRCRLSQEGKRRGFNPHQQDREGEYLGQQRVKILSGPDRGQYRNDPDVVLVLWDGNKTISHYHRDYIEIIDNG